MISPVTHEDGIDRVTIRVDARYAGTPEDVRTTTYVFAGDGATLVTTMTGVTHADDVDHAMQPVLASVRVPRRSFLPGLGRAIGTYVVPAQLLCVAAILLLAQRRKRTKRA